MQMMTNSLAAPVTAAPAETAVPPHLTPSPSPGPSVTPTIDRLAAPPTVENPSQADEGAQIYWLNCQPCHGDRGQGLTDEWRMQYPEEDQYCWGRGCHGNQPYLDGFMLPTQVPAVIGPGSLEKFETMGQLYQFIKATMPFEAPGVLSNEEYLAIVAHLAQAHGVWDGRPFTDDNIYEFRFKPLTEAQQTATAVAAQERAAATATATFNRAQEIDRQNRSNLILLVVGTTVFLLAPIGGAWLLWQRKNLSSRH